MCTNVEPKITPSSNKWTDVCWTDVCWTDVCSNASEVSLPRTSLILAGSYPKYVHARLGD